MKKKVLISLLLLVSLISFTGCFDNKKENKVALAFKNDYEELNGKTNKSGKEHRTISISEDNRFVEITMEELMKKIDSGDSFYVYFGSRLCPWCRSVIEMADKVSRENDIEKVYYIDIWDDEGNELIRDKYTIDENNKLVLEKEGTEEYKKLLELFGSLLRDYTLTDNNGDEVAVGEKRIYAPNYFYINKGKAVRMITGKSDTQKDAREELTEEMLKDEEEKFDKFFINACDETC
ncbi:MAG: hypothetical protein IKO78_03330 [Bacilli bacterium]|nr:hypothetical protein [Bacilli bacterium]